MRDLASKCRVKNVIMQFKAGINTREATLQKFRTAFEEAGIEFISSFGIAPSKEGNSAQS